MNAQIQIASRFALGFMASIGLTACSPGSPKLNEKKGPEKISTSENINFNPKIDILFVVDNSFSMDEPQDNLSQNIPKFVAGITRSKILDYHIGVITSTYKDFTMCGKACDGALYGGPSQTKFVSRSTPNGAKVLSENLLVGTTGGGKERFFLPSLAALTAPLRDTVNRGFYRPDASLVVIFLTDTDDQSGMTPRKYLESLLALKDNDSKRVSNYAAIIPTNSRTCDREATETAPKLIEEMLALAGQNPLDLCDSDFGTKLSDLATKVAKEASIIYLDRLPVADSIVVNYGDIVIPRDVRTGWSYNADLNAVVFGSDFQLPEQPEGTKIEVNFNAAL